MIKVGGGHGRLPVWHHVSMRTGAKMAVPPQVSHLKYKYNSKYTCHWCSGCLCVRLWNDFCQCRHCSSLPVHMMTRLENTAVILFLVLKVICCSVMC